jgi:ATP-dependent DNA helicase RecG
MLDKKVSEVVRTTKVYLSTLEEMGIKTAKDLLLNFPWRYSDESEFVTIADLVVNEQSTVRGTLSGVFSRNTNTGKSMIRAKFSDSTGDIDVMWFNQNYLKQVLKNGMEVVLTGKLKWSGSRGSFMSPKYEVPKVNTTLIHTGRMVPVYHETGKISSKWLREKIQPILYMTQFLADPLPEEVLLRNELMPLSEAVKQVHFPESDELLESARYRLGFEELFLIQLRAIQRKMFWKQAADKDKKPLDVSNKVVQEFLATLPFTLTGAQQKVLDEICLDLSDESAMSRLLEGDVGSGKTIVAAAAIFVAVKSGYQAAIMVPTEILAKQHYKTLFKLLKDFGVNIQLLTGSLKKSAKDDVIAGLKSGLINVAVGTHSLIQQAVGFKKLGLAVIDEQHRFGVNQRAVLKGFGAPHMLSMTATPIPRTLALTLYGDQDLSIIDELPPGRQVIVTRTVPEKKRDDAYLWIASEIEKGRQAFVVCPLIEESETLEVKSALEEYERLQEHVFPQFKLGLLHGKMRQADKDDIMMKFADHEIDILVSTTVIEVGIDVPNASIMVIEASDRFGLAQLHQLRGRVGRGEHQSYCFLFPESNSEMSRKRMKAMCDHSDGFKLAEIDLELRGPGEVYGIRQSGIPDLKMASLSNHELLKLARDEAELILKDDPMLEKFPELAYRASMDEVVIDY